MVSIPSYSQTRRALVIGLGKQQDAAWAKINGDKDVDIVVKMLKYNHFNDISTLVNAAATKQGIVNDFAKLTARCKPGDIIYIHFSGHGQRMTDVDGDEKDGYDESWIPYDAYKSYCQQDHGEKHLCDDEIGRMLTLIREKVGERGNIIVTVDACHSGDSTRDLNDDTVNVRGVFEDFVIPVVKRGSARQIEERWLTLSACLSNQLNQEHPSGYGKLTYGICTLWREMKEKNNAEVLSIITRYMKRKGVRGKYPQTPILTGCTDKYLFSTLFYIKNRK